MGVPDRVLDAYVEILNDEGERAATLDAIAARAGVSKGGLLYHFPNLEALTLALVERLEQLSEARRSRLESAPEGPSLHHIRTGRGPVDTIDTVLLAVARLASVNHPRARAALRSTYDVIHDLIARETHDEVAASVILALGDGLHYQRLLGAPTDPEQVCSAAVELIRPLLPPRGADDGGADAPEAAAAQPV